MLVFFMSALWGPLAFAANLTVTPVSGPGGTVVTATSSGFDTGHVGYNTGFYVTSDDVHYQFLGACPGPPGTDSWANCSIQIRMPGPTGPYTVAAFNSNREFASTGFEVLKPSLAISVSCAPDHTVSIVVTGQLWAIDYDAGIYLDGSLVRAGNYPSSAGAFTQTILGPSTVGVHTVQVFNSDGQNESKTYTTPVCGTQTEEEHVIPLPMFCVGLGVGNWSLDFSDGQRLEVTCDGFPPAYRLWHTTPSGERRTIAECIFNRGINFGIYWATPDLDGDGKPDHLVKTAWFNIDGGGNDGQSDALAQLNPRANEPYLDTITYTYDAARNKYGWVAEKYDYPTDDVMSDSGAVFNYLQTHDSVPGLDYRVDPPVDEESQRFFDLLQTLFAELPQAPMTSVLVCDLNGDHRCDDVDVAIFKASLGLCKLQPGFAGVADIDRDGCVTQADKDAWTEYLAYYRNDGDAPTLTIPVGAVLEATGPGGATATFSASALDTIEGIVPTTCAPASGSTFAVGVTTVNCSATDHAGNTAVGNFAVLVRDTTKPTLTLPSNVILAATSPTGAQATFTVTASDIVDVSDPVTCLRASGSIFPIGTSTVSCNTSDRAGNSVSGSFTVHVDGAIDQISQLIALVRSFHVSTSTESALVSKLEDARTHVAAGRTTSACSTMQAFINGVNDKLKAKSVTSAQATQMLTAANRIRAVLGC